MNTKKLLLKTMGFIFTLFFALGFTSCSNPAGDDTVVSSGYNDIPVTSFAGTTWTDDLIPESTIRFVNTTQLELEGRYWEATKPGTLAGPHLYEVSNNLSPNEVEPAIWIIIDSNNRTALEVHYYKAAGSKHQRLVVWRPNLLQPREFYLH
jgi:hypothetical protein